MKTFQNARVYQTRGICCAAEESFAFKTDLMQALIKFMRKDWGNTPQEDKELNNEALKYKDRIIAAYTTSEGRIWIIAESEDGKEYTVITILFPEEY